MSGRAGWAGMIAGLVVGVVLGVWLLIIRPGVWQGDLDETPPAATGDTVATIEAGEGETSPDSETLEIGASLQAERENAIVRATRRVAPAVVSINVVQQKAVRNPTMEFWERMGMIQKREYYSHVQSMGSGVIVSSDGLVVTNQHVVADAVQVLVTLSNGQQYPAALVETVPRYDLAFLRIEGEDFPYAKLAGEEDLQIGEWAIAIGSPFGYLLADTQPTVTVGVISALNRDIKRAQGEREYLGMIQTDAAINPGNSGGPLVNTAGEVVGINTFIFSDSGGSVGIGFAVPAARVLSVIREIQEYGHYREFSLGFTLQKLSPSMVQSLKLDDPVGFLIVAVTPGQAAWKAGLRLYDILREVDGRKLDSVDVLYRLIYETQVGDVLRFRAERNGEMFEGDILIEEVQ